MALPRGQCPAVETVAEIVSVFLQLPPAVWRHYAVKRAGAAASSAARAFSEGTVMLKVEPKKEVRGWVHCPICTHTVEALVILTSRLRHVKPGQRCPRCLSSLDAAAVVHWEAAA